MHATTGLSLVCSTPTAIKISVRHVPVASGLIPVCHRIGIHLSWSALPPTSTDVGLHHGESPCCSTGRLHLEGRGYGSRPDFAPFSKSISMLTLDFDPSRIFLEVGSVPPTMSRSRLLPGVRSVPPTTGRSISGVFFEGFRLWTGSSPPTCYCTFTSFSWKLGIMAVSNNAFQSWNHSVGLSF